MSQTLASVAFAPAAAQRPAVASAIRRILAARARRMAGMAEGIHFYGVIEGLATIATLGFLSLAVAAFW